ncbi:hypothetical protein GGF46_002822 [Coemansia sp. RSA 552]|nr:hypothetical protein GGF46_002822 [Coemansia sp. RSA 552]
MGICCSRPRVDDDDDEHAALLGEASESITEPQTPDRYANLSAEEARRLREEERLKVLEQNTTEALINISHHTSFGPGPAMTGSGNHARDYTEVLRRFNQEVRLPLATLAGPSEVPRGVDVAAVLAEGRIADADAGLIDDAINRIIDVISIPHIDPPPGDCITSLSVPSDGA